MTLGSKKNEKCVVYLWASQRLQMWTAMHLLEQVRANAQTL